MRKKTVAVIDFGSSKITVLVGKKIQNGNFNILGSGEAECSVFYKGEFLDLDKIGSSIKQALVQAENSCKLNISSIYIGVPATFTVSICKEISQNYKHRVRISERYIESLYDLGNDFARYKNYRLLSASPINFELDDGSTCIEVIGKITSKLKANVSYLLCEDEFCSQIEEILRLLGVKIDGFMPSVLAENEYLLSGNVNTNVVLIDCGCVSTSVSINSGKGILALNEFSSGGGNITEKMMAYLNLKYSAVEALKKKMTLSITPSGDEMYEVKACGKILAVNMTTANQIVEAQVKVIAKTILKCLQQHKELIKGDEKFYLTGGGLSIKGAKEILGNELSKNIEVLSPSIPSLARPQYSSAISLLHSAMEYKNKYIHYYE